LHAPFGFQLSANIDLMQHQFQLSMHWDGFWE
jgi:hypothetical protein